MDALLATKVMGWGNARQIYSGKWIANLPRYMEDKAWRFGDHRDWGEFPRYSKDIAAAWEVVEKMKDSHRATIKSDASGSFYCDFTPINGQSLNISPFTKNIAEAICKAALLATLREGDG